MEMPFITKAGRGVIKKKSPKTPLRNSYAQVTVAVHTPLGCLKVPACQGSLAVDPDSES